MRVYEYYLKTVEDIDVPIFRDEYLTVVHKGEAIQVRTSNKVSELTDTPRLINWVKMLYVEKGGSRNNADYINVKVTPTDLLVLTDLVVDWEKMFCGGFYADLHESDELLTTKNHLKYWKEAAIEKGNTLIFSLDLRED